MSDAAKQTTKRIIDRIYPILTAAVSGPEANIVRDRILKALGEVLDDADAERARMRTGFAAAMATQKQADATEMQRQVAAARAEEQASCRQLREADATSAQMSLDKAVAAARAEEKQTAYADAVKAAQAAETKRLADVALARADEVAKCAALRASDAQTAEAKRLADVAKAKADTRALILTEIQAAPVTGITIALTLFASSMRDQIKTYVSKGPY